MRNFLDETRRRRLQVQPAGNRESVVDPFWRSPRDMEGRWRLDEGEGTLADEVALELDKRESRRQNRSLKAKAARVGGPRRLIGRWWLEGVQRKPLTLTRRL